MNHQNYGPGGGGDPRYGGANTCSYGNALAGGGQQGQAVTYRVDVGTIGRDGPSCSPPTMSPPCAPPPCSPPSLEDQLATLERHVARAAKIRGGLESICERLTGEPVPGGQSQITPTPPDLSARLSEAICQMNAQLSASEYLSDRLYYALFANNRAEASRG